MGGVPLLILPAALLFFGIWRACGYLEEHPEHRRKAALVAAAGVLLFYCLMILFGLAAGNVQPG